MAERALVAFFGGRKGSGGIFLVAKRLFDAHLMIAPML